MTDDDPFLWLEEIEGAAALGWVAAQNARSLAALESDPRYEGLYRDALAVITASDRIPYSHFLGNRLVNFWQDDVHQRGLWRCTSLASFMTPEPDWRTLLDIDALSAAEGRNWVFHGSIPLRPAYRRCLVSLSDGGQDAAELRDFDIEATRFIEGGFFLPEGKQSAVWLDDDALIVGRDWGPGTMTASGYPFVLKRLSRGAPLGSAQEIFRGTEADVSVNASVLRDPDGRVRGILVNRQINFFESERFLIAPRGPVRVAVPAKSSFRGFVAGQLVFSLEEEWREHRAGALVSLDLDACLADAAGAVAVSIVTPGPRESIEDVATTRTRLLATVYRNVQGSAVAFRFEAGQWVPEELPLPQHASVHLVGGSDRDDRAFVDVAGYLTPNTLFLADAATATAAAVKSLPARFDTSGLTVEQFEATSSDGTAVPYFVVRPKGLAFDGSAPTLLYGYGGFQVSMTPSYAGALGKLWLEKGGVYAVANIRGGGEFGPE